MTLTEEEVLRALSGVKDPELHRDLVSLGMVRDIRIDGNRVGFQLVLTTPACPMADRIVQDARQALERLPGVTEVEISVTAEVPKGVPERTPLKGVRNIIGVGSGKGGVGKTTVAVNLAAALAQRGALVGLLDADIYGPNVPRMLGTHQTPEFDGEKILPVSAWGLKMISLGLLLDPDKPVIWRGPILAKALQQLLFDVRWGELDYLLVDLPPGTGDVQLSLAQLVPVTGAVIVTTPQDVAFYDALKGLNTFERLQVPVLGIVENMSYFVCPHCGQRTDIFRRGAVEQECEIRGIRFLGTIPLVPEICESGDLGQPVVLFRAESEASRAFHRVAEQVAAAVSVLNLSIQKAG
ncbi:MAG: Mrp/NBP35 family ATP-binding protein [Armatimonadetes bacterium]|nr:Mrp/NBP35 family ATP-binding protein [Armatimonadota bacterium]MDW8122845.1 Mrp/NBP35 family ATP-binding protein [Armatimonadota bacterium]